MQFSLLTATILLLTSSTLTLAFPSPLPSPYVNLDTRQQLAAPNPDITCGDYARLANYTAIDSNATYRAAFLRSSPQGTDPTRAILDRAAKEYTTKKLMYDRELNRRCGNFSTVALREVASNFSSGVVGPFKIVDETGATIGAGVEAWTGLFILLMFMGFGASI